MDSLAKVARAQAFSRILAAESNLDLARRYERWLHLPLSPRLSKYTMSMRNIEHIISALCSTGRP
jgi:hypothetical protein